MGDKVTYIKTARGWRSQKPPFIHPTVAKYVGGRREQDPGNEKRIARTANLPAGRLTPSCPTSDVEGSSGENKGLFDATGRAVYSISYTWMAFDPPQISPSVPAQG